MKKLLASAAVLAFATFPITGPLSAQETATESDTEEMMEVDAGTVLATVNGNEITIGHLVAMRDLLPEQ